MIAIFRMNSFSKHEYWYKSHVKFRLSELLDYINLQTERPYAKAFHLNKFATCKSICICMPIAS